MYLINKEKINRALNPQIADARVARVFNSFQNVLLTSSFGTTSAILLHIVSRIQPECPVYFIDSGYLFQETLAYKEQLTRLLNLNVHTINPDSEEHRKTREKQMWADDPDRCCQINKLDPLHKLTPKFQVWMSGLLGYQNRHRNSLDIVEDQTSILKFYPLIDWTPSLVEEYMENHGLPRHPLAHKGYASVGCTHCTVPGNGRDGRWPKLDKTECGLHR